MKKHSTIFIVALNLLLIVGQFVLTNTRSVEGHEIARIKRQIDQLAQANTQLKGQILEYSSISYLQRRAQDQSLVPLTISVASALSVAAAKP
jgi:cell division protein FtsL